VHDLTDFGLGSTHSNQELSDLGPDRTDFGRHHSYFYPNLIEFDDGSKGDSAFSRENLINGRPPLLTRLLLPAFCLRVQRASHSSSTFIQNVSVDHSSYENPVMGV